MGDARIRREICFLQVTRHAPGRGLESSRRLKASLRLGPHVPARLRSPALASATSL